MLNFVDSLEEPPIAKIDRIMDVVEQYGTSSGMPYVKKIINNLFEIRVRGKEEVRLLFTVKGQQIVIVHGFRKKTMKIPPKELQTALKRISLI